MEPVTLWSSEVCMAFGAVACTVMSLRARSQDRHHYLISIVVCLVATASYLAMALGQTRVELSDGHAVIVARYVDWALTTPLLLLGTATIGMGALAVDKTLAYAAMAADVFMIGTGFAGAASSDRSRWIWFAYSCIAFCAVLVLLWGPIRRRAAEQGREKPFVALIAILTALWIQYPFVWLLGDEGARVLGHAAATLWYSVLDVAAKVPFGFVSLATVRSLPPAIEEGGTAPAEQQAKER